MNAMSLDNKINNTKLNKMCYLCKNTIESRDHLFFECKKTKSLFCKIKNKMSEKNAILNKEVSIYHTGLKELDAKIISIFNLAIWKVRNILAFPEQKVKDIESCFLRTYKIISHINR